MKSIAIWYKPLDFNLETIEKLDLHFNFWKIPNGTSKSHKFLDIGIKISNTKNIEALKIYFPVRIKDADFEDIVEKFIHKVDLVSAIFNENYKVISTATSKSFEIKDTKNEFVFNIYKTSISDLIFEDKYEGTVVSICIPKEEKTNYFRFRIKGDFINSLTTISRPTNSIFQSAFSEIEMIDFRVNEIRDLNHDLLEQINVERLLKIQKQHFFFICSKDEELIGNHQPFLSCRNLENYKWDDYVGNKKIDNQTYLAYHWKEKEVESVSTLIKTKYEKNNWKTIAKYTIFAVIFAVVVNLVSNWLYEVIKGI
ncbi:hypothetical protein SAMN05443667_11826 [Flavobacterium gillisiae]|uniref:Uncharacterized protein n=1 Tax=Flavobacterium gillisiae TaxID=150146 RepID=A0A1H4G8R3_9FLAO|nr:hypothetical protein [Flavobacterium gillisiae]SEB05979.1 hypothetical protein SAMN05443667_11826 [Flavobacterium gillisiae]